MFRLLSDLEVALNELLVACRESVDHFRDATQLISAKTISYEFIRIADTREYFIPKLEQRIRELGDLPSVPDPDKEDSEMLLHHLGAVVADDYTHKVLQQRIAAEKNIVSLIEQASSNDADNFCGDLLKDLASHAHSNIEKLSALDQSLL